MTAPAHAVQAPSDAVADPAPLGTLPPAERETLVRRARVQRIAPGEFLYREGEASEGLAIVRSGAGEVHLSAGGRAPHRVGEFQAGDVLAIASTLTGQRHLASARALVETDVLRISRWELRRVCRRHPVIALHLQTVMEERLSALLWRMDWLAAGAAARPRRFPSAWIEDRA